MHSAFRGFLVCCGLASWAAAQESAATAPGDQEIANAVERELWTDPVVDANQIDVECRQGIVSLDGSTGAILPRDRAEAIAASVLGVRGIVNLIEVEAVSIADEELAGKVRAALLADPAADSYEVSPSVSDGVVTLKGTVDSWPEKQLCSMVAKTVPGVRRVANQIDIDRATDRPDAEVQPEIVARLANDVAVDDHLIEVEVDDGAVTLRGTVGSLAEKRRAVADAWVAGVDSVSSDDLEVQPWARDRLRRREAYVVRSDAELQRAVQDAFLYDPRVLSYEPQIDVDDGLVTLRGVVADMRAKRAAEATASNVLGVRRVNNYLKVRPKAVPNDDVLRERVASALTEDPYVESTDVGVAAFRGRVYLFGRVNSSFEQSRANLVASGVAGVTDVVNRITHEYTWSWKPDWELRSDVEDELFWSPFVDSDAVQVAVEDGVVTLTGTVATWSERSAAAENAWEAGAKDVRNRLQVTYPFYGPHFPYHLAVPAGPSAGGSASDPGGQR